ncbi:MAG: hypothetical protein PHR35_20415, partial [Kiritimatiellae bacterium]|nr:hypothetical protein [Kiritimatiellia bacterium]
GLVDAWRLPKMSVSYLQARTARDLFLGVHGDWADRGDGAIRRIHVFSNAEWLVASVKEKTLARVPARRYTTLLLPFSPDVLHITAERGDEHRSAHLVPHGVAAQIVVEPDRSSCRAADRETVGMGVRVVDSEGRTASDYQGELRVTAEGPVRVRFFSSEDLVEIRAGRGRCFVTGTGGAGVATLSAAAEGLRPGVARIEYTMATGSVLSV